MNGDVITWDDDTLEVDINGQDYPGSSIVDMKHSVVAILVRILVSGSYWI